MHLAPTLAYLQIGAKLSSSIDEIILSHNHSFQRCFEELFHFICELLCLTSRLFSFYKTMAWLLAISAFEAFRIFPVEVR